MRNANKLLIIILTTLMTGCSYMYGETGVIRNRNMEYTRAESIPPLKIPPGLSSSTIEAHYPVSDADYPNSKVPVNLIPPELNTTS